MSGRRVKALRREFVKVYDKVPRKAEREMVTRTINIGTGRFVNVTVPGPVVQSNELRAFRKAHRRAA